MSREYYGRREFTPSRHSSDVRSGPSNDSRAQYFGSGRSFMEQDSSSRNGFCRDDEKRPALALYDQFRPKPGENRPRSVDMRPQRHGDARAKTAFSSTNVENRPRKEELKEPVASRPIISKPSATTEVDDVTDYRALLEELYPSATFSVELPYTGNGNLYQVRMTVYGEIFYGRAGTEEEAVSKCCKKATRCILQRDLNSNHVIDKEVTEPQRSSQPKIKPSRQESRAKPAERGSANETRSSNVGSRSALERRTDREKELRGGSLATVLDRVDAWNRSLGTTKAATTNSRVKPEPRSNQHQERRNVEKHVPRDENFNRGIVRASSPVPSNFSVDKSSKEFDDSTSSLNGSVDWKYKQIPIKNAVMMLNEMFPPPSAPQYKVISQTGPPNNPTFSMVCCIQDQTFLGEGKSKKEAKLACSQKAIEAICGTKMTETSRAIPEKSNPRANCDLDDWMELEGKNPVSILNELYPGIQYQLVSTSGPSHAPLFVIKASLNEMSFEGSGKSKKDAKLNASKALLVHLHKVGFDPMTGIMMSTQQDNTEVAEGHSLADRIGQLVTAKYQALFGTTTYSKRRVMAGIVMTRNCGGDVDVDLDDEAYAKVICVSSGTKCINGAQLSLEGCVVNDSHAEIVARRCMLVYFYQQLVKLAQDEDSIFVQGDDGYVELQDGIEFHLFITTSPCGDARIFSMHETPATVTPVTQSTVKSSTVLNKLPSSLVKSQSAVGLSNSAPADLIDLECKSEPDLAHFQNPINESGIEEDPAKDTESNLTGSCLDATESLSSINNIDLEEDQAKQDKDSSENINDDNNNKEICTNEHKDRRQADSSKGMLRSKIECGMGTIPITKATIQTWDGVLIAERLMTMSCSDKIMRWNVIGIQGALLSILMKPIYLKSITVGSKFHPGHMNRALYGRIADHVSNLPPHYRLNVPQLYATTSPETRQATKAHDYSVNWIVDQGQPEIVNGSTGKTINDSTSRLSKRSLFEEFLAVSNKLKKSALVESPARYSEVKELAKDYQTAKNQVGSILISAGCGQWVEKPVEQDQFSL